MEVEKFYQREAKELTDMLFDKGFLADDLTRESIVWLEDYLGFVLQSKTESAVKAALLTKKVKDRHAGRVE
jgi:hypothetical protein